MQINRHDAENQIIPIHGDALELPYPDEYFDAVISVDSYHFFGAKANYMDEKLAPHVKSGGINPYAKKDCVAMEAGAYKYMNHISIKHEKINFVLNIIYILIFLVN